MTSPLYVSLARYENQKIPTDSYTLLTFPATSSDDYVMAGRDRSIIVPEFEGLACLEMNVIWEPAPRGWPVGGKLQYVFTREPHGKDDRTGYNHVAPVLGVNCFTSTHWLKVYPDVPLGVLVAQRSGYPLNVTHAQFKMTLFPKEQHAG